MRTIDYLARIDKLGRRWFMVSVVVPLMSGGYVNYPLYATLDTPKLTEADRSLLARSVR